MPFECWKCGAPLRVDVGQPGGVSRSTRAGLAARLFKPRRYEQSTYAPPVVNVQPPPAQVGALNPNETAYRTLDGRADIRPQLEMGLVCGLLVGVLAGCVYVGATVEGAAPVAVIAGLVDVTVGVVFVRLNWDVLVQGSDGRLITRKRDAEMQPTTDPQPWHVTGELVGNDGHRTLYNRFDITKPWPWHHFCRAVHYDGKNFSGAEAKKHKVPPRDWAAVSTAWTENQWLTPVLAGETPEPRGPGQAWIKAFATTPPPSPEKAK